MRKAALKRHEGYSAAYKKLQAAKEALDEAEKAALGVEAIKEQFDHQDGVRICRIEELKILGGMLDTITVACKKDPMQPGLFLFFENNG